MLVGVLLVLLVTGLGCIRPSVGASEPAPDPTESSATWHEWALTRWASGDLDAAEQAFQISYRNAQRQETSEVMTILLLDWAELSLARHEGGAALPRLDEAQNAVQDATQRGQFGESDLRTYRRLVNTLRAAALRDVQSPDAAADQLGRLRQSPWGADNFYYLGTIRAEQGRTREAVEAFKAYVDATPRLGLLRRAPLYRAEAAAYVAAHS